MEILISDQQEQVPLTPALLELVQRVAAACLEQQAGHLGAQVEVSITFVDDGAMRELNREHRGIDQPTDVLSFSQLESGGDEPPLLVDDESTTLLGDVVVSLERAELQAGEYRHSLEREVGFLVVHGLLHLLGYDHQSPEEEERMQATTEGILNGLGLTR